MCSVDSDEMLFKAQWAPGYGTSVHWPLTSEQKSKLDKTHCKNEVWKKYTNFKKNKHPNIQFSSIKTIWVKH